MKSTSKTILFLIITLNILISCLTKKKVDLDHYYKVTKIDSINNFYIIYIKGGDARYKIVSKKESESYCNQIKVRKGYSEFILEKLIMNERYYPTVHPEILNKQDFVPNCIKMDDGKTEVCRDTGMDNIYRTPNLKGLCYKKLPEKKQDRYFLPSLKIEK